MTHKNQHEWGVVGQSFDPYREFIYCPLCRQYREDDKRMTKREFTAITQSIEMYEPDSAVRLIL